MSKQKKTDFDGGWKTVIKQLSKECVAYFFPVLYQQMDLSKPIIFLDKEFQKLIVDGNKKGEKRGDILFQVPLKNGENKCVLIHHEVERGHKTSFSTRAFRYFYRIFDVYGDNITMIAIFIGAHVPSNAGKFEYNFLGTKVSYTYNTCIIKKQEEPKLKQSDNPFALTLLAGLYTIRSEQDEELRFRYKRTLIKLAREKNYSRNQLKALFYFIKHTVKLSPKKEQALENQIIQELKKEKNMIVQEFPYVDPIFKAFFGGTVDEVMERYKNMFKKLDEKKEQLGQRENQLVSKESLLGKRENQLVSKENQLSQEKNQLSQKAQQIAAKEEKVNQLLAKTILTSLKLGNTRSQIATMLSLTIEEIDTILENTGKN